MIGSGFASVLLFFLLRSSLDLFSLCLRDVFSNSLKEVILFWAYLFSFLLFDLVDVNRWGNWEFLFFGFGVFLALIIQLSPLLNVLTQKHVKKTSVYLQASLLIIFILGMCLEIQIESTIGNAYTEFCREIREQQNYITTYSYFSPEYRKEKNLDEFTKELPNFLDDSCNTGSNDSGFNGKFNGAISVRFGKAFLYPYNWTYSACSFYILSGPYVVLTKVNGRWYFTGKHGWSVD